MKDNILNNAKKVRRGIGEKSIFAFVQLYLSHHLKYVTTEVHKNIYKVLEEITIERGKKIVLAAPRGFAKSSTITLFYILYCLCYAKEKFIIVLSHSRSQVLQIMENVKNELVNNKAIMEDFPEIFEFKGAPKPPKWKADEIMTKNGIDFLVLSQGQRIRGRRHREHRPSLVIADDLEDDEQNINSEQSEKILKWYNSSVGKVGDEQTNFIMLGTVHHPYSVLSIFLSREKYPTWIKMKYAAIEEWPSNMQLWNEFSEIRNFNKSYKDATGPEAAKRFYEDNEVQMNEGAKLLWPERWSLFDLMSLYDDDEFSFMREMQNAPRDVSEYSLPYDDFHYYTEIYKSTDEFMAFKGKECTFTAGCDPSMGGDLGKGDYSAIVVLARDKEGIIYILEADVARRSPDKLVRDIFCYYERYKFTRLAFEANQCQELFVKMIEKEGRERGQYIPIEPIVNTKRKKPRIYSLYTWMKNGTIRFNKYHKMLLDQCRDFPQMKHDDGPDALELAVRMIEHYTTPNLEERLKMIDDINKRKGIGPKDIWRQGSNGRTQIFNNDEGLFDIK